jgi:hypothetical protein
MTENKILIGMKGPLLLTRREDRRKLDPLDECPRWFKAL